MGWLHFGDQLLEQLSEDGRFLCRPETARGVTMN